MSSDRALNVLISLALISAAAGTVRIATSQERTEQADETVFEHPAAKAPLIFLDDLRSFDDPGRTLTPPSGESGLIADVAFGGGSVCTVAAADRATGLIHVYDEDGAWRMTVDDGPADGSAIAQVNGLAVSDEGDIYASDLSWVTIARFGADGTRRWVRRTESTVDFGFGVGDLAVALDGRVFNHWFGHMPPGAELRDDWEEERPLVWVYGDDGEVVGEIGRMEPVDSIHGTEILTPILNQSRVMVDGDTVWLANKTAARLTAFVESSAGGWQEVRTVQLPVLFRAETVRHFARPETGRFGFVAHQHLLDIDRVPSLGWVVSQAVSYVPDQRSSPTDAVLVGYDNVGQPVGFIRTEGQPRAVAASATRIVATLFEDGADGRRAVLIRNPFWPEAGQGDCGLARNRGRLRHE